MTPPHAIASDRLLNRRGGSALCTDVFDQNQLGPNLRRFGHRARHDVGGDTMGCMEAGISAGARATLVRTVWRDTRLYSTGLFLVVVSL